MGLAAVCMLSASACSGQSVGNGTGEAGGETGEAAGGTSEIVIESHEGNPADPSDIAEVGETLVWESVWKTSMEYTVEKVETVENLNETQIKSEDFSNASVVKENGSFAMPEEAGNEGKCVFLLVTVKVKNIDFLGYQPDAKQPELFAENLLSLSGALDNTQDVNAWSADYFSGHREENRDKDYFKYTLQPGEETELSIGWVIPEEKMQQELYYIIGIGTDHYMYVRLNEGESNQ